MSPLLLFLSVPSNTTLLRNYTGDVLNFGLAKEQYAASHPEQADRVKLVVVGDDVAVGKTQGRMVGRRFINCQLVEYAFYDIHIPGGLLEPFLSTRLLEH
jgi:dihydroxyacetone kinase